MFDLAMNHGFLNGYNPFREMEDFERNAFNGFFNSQDLAEFKMDVSDEGDHYLLEADLPGFQKEDIDLDLKGDVLTIHAERHSKFEEKDQQDKVVRCERSYGSFSRQFDVSGIDAEHITAKYDNGVLSLNLPKIQQTIPESRKLAIE